MIETAISDGDTAPIASPIGAWMRAMSALLGALRLQPLAALGVGLPRAERADIEAVALEGVQQRRIVDLGIMRHRDERRVVIDVERRQRDVGPFRDQRHVGKPLGARERRARIHHRHVVVERARQRRQRLADMDRADDHEPRGRRVDIEEQLLAAGLDHAALAHAQLLCQLGAQRIGRDILRLHQPLLAIGGIGDHDHRPARGALGIHFRECLEFHD